MKQWYKNRKKDHFYQLAQKNDLISRAYYKLEEIDKKHQIIKKSSKVLDIGCCPGGWSQYVLNKRGNQSVVGVDILPIEKKFNDNFIFYNFDLNEFEKISEVFISKNYCFDVIISDIAPNTSGNQFLDQANSYNLSFLSFQFIKSFLKKGGFFLVKNFQGEDTEQLFKEIKFQFNKAMYIKPNASDKKSKEIYILGLEKK
jgi:23S rRNA (uridine2552-2'-O)-methyltransferase|tara:strand:- start:1003 stop:1602 length:600 start_codon:yes stop_codon:yes gene_type:complete